MNASKLPNEQLNTHHHSITKSQSPHDVRTLLLTLKDTVLLKEDDAQEALTVSAEKPHSFYDPSLSHIFLFVV